MTLSTFFSFMGMTTLAIMMLLGLGYWVKVLTGKFFPNLIYVLKYKVFKMKYNENDVKMLLEDLETGASEYEIQKAILVSGTKTKSQTNELMWIFRELKKLKGGKTQ